MCTCTYIQYSTCTVFNSVLSTRYLRGTEERGLILGSVDEITQNLEDNAMNLQSMAASRFVQPFFDRVQKWEKSLSHISEVVDVSGLSGVLVYIRMYV